MIDIAAAIADKLEISDIRRRGPRALTALLASVAQRPRQLAGQRKLQRAWPHGGGGDADCL